MFESLPVAYDLARTYDPERGYDDPADQLRDYIRVGEYAAENPNKGRTAVGNALDLPPSRVRVWLNGGKPDAVRGVHTAHEHGWLDLDPDTPAGQAFTELCIGIFCCGSIECDWPRPAWTVSTPVAERRLLRAMDLLNLDPARRHADCDERPTELVPDSDGTIFGRCLVAAGAPQGDKNTESLSTLPEWIFEASETTRRKCTELFILERAIISEGKDTLQISTRDRPETYRRSLARLFRSVVDKPVTAGTNVTISANAAHELGIGKTQNEIGPAQS